MTWRVLILILLSALLPCAAAAGTSEDEANCITGVLYNNPDLQIAACTTLIQSEKDPVALAGWFSGRGVGFAAKGDFDRALEDFDQAIKLDSSLAAHFVDRGFAYARKGQFDHATQDFDQAAKLKPDDSGVFDGRGYVYFNKGQYARAVESFDQSLKISDYNAGAYYFRGLAKQKMGDKSGGDADIAKAKQINADVAKCPDNTLEGLPCL